jgi:hypothetical protein
MEFYGVNGFIGLIVLALDIWAIISVLNSSASTGNKAVWVIVIALLPVVGLILWLLMGPRSGSNAVVSR